MTKNKRLIQNNRLSEQERLNGWISFNRKIIRFSNNATIISIPSIISKQMGLIKGKSIIEIKARVVSYD